MHNTPQVLPIEHLVYRLVHPLYEWSIMPIVCCEDRLKFVSPF